MTQSSGLTLGTACYRAVHDYPGGVPAVAATLGLNAATLQNKLNPTQANHKLNDRDIEGILELTRDPRILDALSRAGGGLWVPLAHFRGQASDMAMLDHITELVQKVGELSATVQTSLADGQVDAEELVQLETGTLRLTQAAFAVLERAKQFMRPDPHPLVRQPNRHE